jgi:hypothetical protein
MKKIVQVFFIFSLAIVIGSCVRKNPADIDSIEIGIPYVEMNKKMTIRAIDNLNSYSAGGEVFLEVINLSNTPILVSPDNDIVIYQKKGNQMIEIEDEIDHSGAVKQIPTKQEDPFGVGSFPFMVVPKIITLEKNASLRIYIIGTVIGSNGILSNEKVGAFIDIDIHP